MTYNQLAEQSRAEQSRAEQSRAEQSRAEQSRAEQSRAEQSRACGRFAPFFAYTNTSWIKGRFSMFKSKKEYEEK
ncbi:hypothetical protein [Lactococcus formosensis]|uniref:hypothetical protein n=1 Tax=Lactococcus formosensis TaxID=1281486 RepID=UPI0024354418|nr:hypothetical protein [Lactococcus formosensis]MDG6121653.1 hypothetical protein [Lactococcus formosensis]